MGSLWAPPPMMPPAPAPPAARRQPPTPPLTQMIPLRSCFPRPSAQPFPTGASQRSLTSRSHLSQLPPASILPQEPAVGGRHPPYPSLLLTRSRKPVTGVPRCPLALMWWSRMSPATSSLSPSRSSATRRILRRWRRVAVEEAASEQPGPPTPAVWGELYCEKSWCEWLSLVLSFSPWLSLCPHCHPSSSFPPAHSLLPGGWSVSVARSWGHPLFLGVAAAGRKQGGSSWGWGVVVCH